MSQAPREPESPPPGELLALSRWEQTAGWLLQQTGRWPKSARFAFATRTQALTLEIAERLVGVRYDKARRGEELRAVNLDLERLRLLLRLARDQGVMAPSAHEQAQRRIDEVGRLVHGLRQAGRP